MQFAQGGAGQFLDVQQLLRQLPAGQLIERIENVAHLGGSLISGHDGLAEAAVFDPDDASSSDPGNGQELVFDDFRVHLQAPGGDDGIQAAGDFQAPVGDAPAIGGGEPAGPVGVGESFVARHVAVARGDGGPAEHDAPGFHCDGAAGQGAPVVDAAACGFGAAVGGDELDAQLARRLRQLWVECGPADEDGVEAAQRGDAFERVDGFIELHGGQRRVHGFATPRAFPVSGVIQIFGGGSKLGDAEAMGKIQTHGIDPGDQAAHQHLDARDVIGGQGQ